MEQATATRAGTLPLLDAALAIAAEQGVSSVTVRAVAERARVSPGTVSYHFASADKLLVSALEHGATQTAQMLERLALDVQATDGNGENWAPAFAAALADDLKARRAQHLACFELQLMAARRPELLPVATKIQSAYARVARMVAQAHGAPDPDAAAIGLTALVTGLVLGELVHDQPGAEERLLAVLLGQVDE